MSSRARHVVPTAVAALAVGVLTLSPTGADAAPAADSVRRDIAPPGPRALAPADARRGSSSTGGGS